MARTQAKLKPNKQAKSTTCCSAADDGAETNSAAEGTSRPRPKLQRTKLLIYMQRFPPMQSLSRKKAKAEEEQAVEPEFVAEVSGREPG